MSDKTTMDAERSRVQLGDPEAALERLREFHALLDAAISSRPVNVPASRWEQLYKLLPLIEDIARRIEPDNVAELASKRDSGSWRLGPARDETLRLIGILERHEERERILGLEGPTLAAGGLHRWVWNAAVDLWDGGYYKEAVNAAAAAVEEQTHLKLDRGDLSGTDLYTQAFKVGKIGETPDGCRLRFQHLDELTEGRKRNQSWVSAHEGAMHFGRGCAQGIRNLNAHGTGELPEQEALEYLASLSVLARWVDACEPVPAGTNSQA